MSIKDKLKTIKQVILDVAEKHGVKVNRIILFGSRARCDYSKDSDWDILIVTEGRLEKELVKAFWLDVKRGLVDREVIPELIIVDKRTFEKYKDLKGFVYGWAAIEGVTI